MGFRSVFISEDCPITWPDWFVEKYQSTLNFSNEKMGTISAKEECKTYYTWVDLLPDIQRAIDWDGELIYRGFRLVYLHEDNVMTVCHIYKDKIDYKWVFDDRIEETDGVWDRYMENSL